MKGGIYNACRCVFILNPVFLISILYSFFLQGSVIVKCVIVVILGAVCFKVFLENKLDRVVLLVTHPPRVTPPQGKIHPFGTVPPSYQLVYLPG